MFQFIIGLVVGMFVAIGIIGFIVVATEEPQQPPKPHNDSWYMEDDGK